MAMGFGFMSSEPAKKRFGGKQAGAGRKPKAPAEKEKTMRGRTPKQQRFDAALKAMGERLDAEKTQPCVDPRTAEQRAADQKEWAKQEAYYDLQAKMTAGYTPLFVV